MKKFLVIISTFMGMMLYLNTACASHPVTFIGPTARVGYTDSLTSSTAYSFAGEAGAKNYRMSGTLGWKIQEDQRLKVTGEYLWQKLNYNFLMGDTLEWVQQGAVGATFEQDFFDYDHKPQVGLNGYYSRAADKSLPSYNAHIAGSNAAGLAPGITIQPWEGSKAGLDINYDYVKYNMYAGSARQVQGWGATARFNQALIHDFDFGLLAGVRQPFNNYQANLNWTTDTTAGSWVLGVGAEYTVGKNSLPSSYNVIASANFIMNRSYPSSSRHSRNLKDDYKHEAMPIDYDDFTQWVSVPAVRMPQVLAIADETQRQTCFVPAPRFISTILNPVSYDADGYFSVEDNFAGNDIVYTLTQVTDWTELTDSYLSIDEHGEIYVYYDMPGSDSTSTYTVTATNCAGSVTSNVFSITVDA